MKAKWGLFEETKGTTRRTGKDNSKGELFKINLMKHAWKCCDETNH